MARGSTVNSSYEQCNSLERGNEQVHEQDDSTQEEQRLTDGNDPAAWNTLELVVRVVDAAVGCQHIIKPVSRRYHHNNHGINKLPK